MKENGSDYMEKWQRAEIYKILLLSITCTKHSGFSPNKKMIIEMDKGNIKTTQSYFPQYSNPKFNKINLDCDMSDFACGFYEIIYNREIVADNGSFTNKNFAGDTMTSVSRLPALKDRYHCLANFWLIPMDIGRTSSWTSNERKQWSKTSDVYKIYDYMDRFLILLKDNFLEYKKLYPVYFANIETFKDFCDIHLLVNSYVDENYEINEFSSNMKEATSAEISEIAYGFMKKRAEVISQSEYAYKLWDYFTYYKLIDIQKNIS